MDIKRIKISEDDKYTFFPPRLWELLDREGTRIYGALEGDKLLGTAVLCERTDQRGGYILCHLEGLPTSPENTASVTFQSFFNLKIARLQSVARHPNESMGFHRRVRVTQQLTVRWRF